MSSTAAIMRAPSGSELDSRLFGPDSAQSGGLNLPRAASIDWEWANWGRFRFIWRSLRRFETRGYQAAFSIGATIRVLI